MQTIKVEMEFNIATADGAPVDRRVLADAIDMSAATMERLIEAYQRDNICSCNKQRLDGVELGHRDGTLFASVDGDAEGGA